MYTWIKGIVGSGKSWLCHELSSRGITCCDTDDVMQKVFNKERENSAEFRALVRRKWSKKHNWWLVLMEKTRENIEELIRDARSYNRPVVVVGESVEGEITGIDQVYFIKMSRKSLGIAYRRLMRREILKIHDSTPRLLEITEHEDIDDIGPLISNVVTPTIFISSPFSYYKEMYARTLKRENEAGSIILTQPEILRNILVDTSRIK
jgi:hypothetical protein